MSEPVKKSQKKRSNRPTVRTADGPGRPSIMTEETINKLEQAFLMGASDREACLYADISQMTLYNFQGRHPEFVERKEKLKDSLTLRARMNVAKRLQDKDNPDIDLSKWYLQCKRKAEFSTKIEAEISGKLTLGFENMSDEELDAIIANPPSDT
jgi:hypothetical protein